MMAEHNEIIRQKLKEKQPSSRQLGSVHVSCIRRVELLTPSFPVRTARWAMEFHGVSWSFTVAAAAAAAALIKGPFPSFSPSINMQRVGQ